MGVFGCIWNIFPCRVSLGTVSRAALGILGGYSGVFGIYSLAASHRRLLTEESLQVFMFSTTEQVVMRHPMPLNFNVDPQAAVASATGGASTEEILQVRSPSWAPI